MSRKRTGLDTSIVVRLLVGEPEEQAALALRTVESEAAAGRRCFLSDVVVAEAYFALHAHYQVPKDRAVLTLLDLLQSGLVEPLGCAVEALESSDGSSSKPGFVDHLIHRQYLQVSAGMVTFEKAAAKLQGAVVLS